MSTRHYAPNCPAMTQSAVSGALELETASIAPIRRKSSVLCGLLVFWILADQRVSEHAIQLRIALFHPISMGFPEKFADRAKLNSMVSARSRLHRSNYSLFAHSSKLFVAVCEKSGDFVDRITALNRGTALPGR